MNSRPREGAKEATFRNATLEQDLLRGRRWIIRISSKMPTATTFGSGREEESDAREERAGRYRVRTVDDRLRVGVAQEEIHRIFGS